LVRFVVEREIRLRPAFHMRLAREWDFSVHEVRALLRLAES